MTDHKARLEYHLHDGYLHNWLVLGPQRISLQAFVAESDDRRPAAEALYELCAGVDAGGPSVAAIAAGAVEPAKPGADVVSVGNFSGQWRYVRCLEDHLVALPVLSGSESLRSETPGLVRGWAFAELVHSADATSMQLALSTVGAADVWLNGQHVCRSVVAAARLRATISSVTLQPGRNQVLVRFDTVDQSVTGHAFALRVLLPGSSDTKPAVPVLMLPTHISNVARRSWLEDVFEAVSTPQYCVGRQENIVLRWPENGVGFPARAANAGPADEELTSVDTSSGFEDEVSEALDPEARSPLPTAGPESPGATSLTIRIQAPDGRVYGEANPDLKPGASIEMGPGYRYPDGPLDVILMPRPKEYYQGNMRVTRRIRLWGLDNNRYTAVPTANYPERRQQTLLRAARRESNLYSEIAKMAVGWWSKLEPRLIASAIDQIQERSPQVYRDCVGLLGMVLRYADAPAFPAGVTSDLQAAMPALVFFDDLPGHARIVGSEGSQLLSAVCEILAVQVAPDLVFTATGRPAEWHRERGEQQALVLMHKMATRGLSAWCSDVVMEELFLALAHIVEFVEDDAVWELATVLLDKLLFALATASYKGVLGCARARTTTASVLGGYLDATSGISKLMWGTGIFTPHIRAAVSLACMGMEDYQLPVLLQEIASGASETELWSIEHHAPEGPGVTLATCRTPDFLLSSVQDTQAGAVGGEEHVWQATLGAGATVFVNHPASASLDDAYCPNFWRGNCVLPRVAQWHDALIALYHFPEDDWLGFTHAYFPRHAFDEVAIHDEWAFARKGEGYLALRASQVFAPVTSGAYAGCELRAYGTEVAWLCQMGRAALDGDFATFQQKVVALPLTLGDVVGAGVRWMTLRGDVLSLNWTAPLMRNGEPVVFDTQRHIENAYCVADFPVRTMDIRYRDMAMRLDFRGPDA